ncbi:DUF2269 family protein [bacterium]|nr:DUF2269 family protein [bacterium]
MVYLIVAVLHVLTALVIVGGGAFYLLYLAPLMRDPENARMFARAASWLPRRVKMVRWHSLIILVLTGLYFLHIRAFTAAIAVKLIVVLAILAVAFVLDFRVAKSLAAAAQNPERAAEAANLRARAFSLGKWLVALAFVAAFVGVLIRFGY